jgi:hypothetical protein
MQHIPRLRRRPNAYFERTADGREQIVLERRNSYHGHQRGDSRGEDVQEEQDSLVNEQVLITRNRFLTNRNNDLQRNNQELYNAVQTLQREKQMLMEEIRQRAARQGIVRELEQKLQRERSRKERAEQKLADERAAWQQEAAQRQRRHDEQAIRERERVQLIQTLRFERREWLEEKERLILGLEKWERLLKDKEDRIRYLEARLGTGRSLGIR